jgi:DNA-binding MarR family transcriptional regulator
MSERVQASSISALQERALDIIGSSPDGLFQSELRRHLCIESSKCSRVVARMQKAGQIQREKVPASSTFLLKLTDTKSAFVKSRVAPVKACFRPIDSYLTEIYLLFLSRGISC